MPSAINAKLSLPEASHGWLRAAKASQAKREFKKERLYYEVEIGHPQE